MKPVMFFAASDIVVIGHEPEMADYDNPRGELYGFSTYVVAEDEFGSRRFKFVKTVSVHFGETEAMRSAALMASALNIRLKDGKLPVAFDTWEIMQAAYGSEAYSREGWEEELIAWERSQEEIY